MSFRITTNGMFRNYQSNLYKNTKTLQDKMSHVETGRVFNSYSEDVVAANRAFQLRRAYWRASDQVDNSDHVLSKYEAAYGVMASVVDGDSENPGLDGLVSAVLGMSDQQGTGRIALGRNLIDTAESVMAMMNSKQGEDFIFAGADIANLPFTWDHDTGHLLYRGIDVTTPKARMIEEFGINKSQLDATDSAYPMTEEEFRHSRFYSANEPEKTFEWASGRNGFTNNAESATLFPYDADTKDKMLVSVARMARQMNSDPNFASTDPDVTYEYSVDSSVSGQFAISCVAKHTSTDGDGVKTVTYDDAVFVDFNYETLSLTGENGVPQADEEAAKQFKAEYRERTGLDYDEALTYNWDEAFESFAAYQKDFTAKNKYDYDTTLNVRKYKEYVADYEAKYPKYSYEDAVKLHNMANETTYVDLGLGMLEDSNGNLLPESAFNSSITGLKFLGYGEDENLIMVMKELGEIFTRCNDDGFLNENDQERAKVLYDKLHDAVYHAQVVHTELSADATYLATNRDRLKDSKLTMNVQIEETEQGDPAEAITNMSWAQYCYNAALRIGNEILSQSLLDYMR